MTLDYGLEIPSRAESPPLSLREEMQRALGRAAPSPDLPERPASLNAERDTGLAAFKARFEAEHPEQAQDLARSVLPAKERQALESMDRYYALKAEIDQSEGVTKTFRQRALSRHVDTMAKDPWVRSHAQRRDPEIAQQLRTRERALTQTLERGGWER